jgi:twitching motility protein PilI
MGKREHNSVTKDRLTPLQVLADYETRSIEHVAGRPEMVEAPGHWRGVGFRIGKIRLAASIDDIVEILTLPDITPVPGSLNWMLGVANVRGTLLPVVDLKQFMTGERTVMHDGQRAIVIKQSGGNAAVVIDELYGQRAFNDMHKSDLLEATDGRYASFVQQAYTLNEQNWNVLNVNLLARTPEFRQASA